MLTVIAFRCVQVTFIHERSSGIRAKAHSENLQNQQYFHGHTHVNRKRRCGTFKYFSISLKLYHSGVLMKHNNPTNCSFDQEKITFVPSWGGVFEYLILVFHDSAKLKVLLDGFKGFQKRWCTWLPVQISLPHLL